MARNPDYQFATNDTAELENLMVTTYEALTGITVHPASPERLFISWVADIILQQRVRLNYIGNQNLPSRATGLNLDALGDLYGGIVRPGPKAAVCTVRFFISEPQDTSILIPKGTRVTDREKALTWATTEDRYISIGDTYLDLTVVCQTLGTVGNGYTAGQISTVVDLYDYCSGCINFLPSAGGADEATDDEYYELLRKSMDAMSTAGPRGAYEYHAKSVSTDIADVAVISSSPGVVDLYVLMKDGTLAGSTLKSLVRAACSREDVRPLTDVVRVRDADLVDYDIELTYYLEPGTSASEMEAAVQTAVETYKTWQRGAFGRDINPSRLISLLMETGIKRVAVTAPVFTPLRTGDNQFEPQVASVRTVTLTNGGYEDE